MKQKKTKKPKLGISANMEAASAATSVPMAVLEAAKDANCPAFRNRGDVDCDAFMAWLAQNPSVMTVAGEAMTKDQAEARKTRADALIREHRLEVLRRSVIPADEMRRTFTRALFGMKARMLGIPSGQAQDLAVENDPIEVEQTLRKAITDALADLSKSEWARMDCPHCGKEIKA